MINVQLTDRAVKAQFAGEDEAQAELLRRIVMDGHRIAAFSETSMNLEDVFLRVTKGEVAQGSFLGARLFFPPLNPQSALGDSQGRRQ